MARTLPKQLSRIISLLFRHRTRQSTLPGNPPAKQSATTGSTIPARVLERPNMPRGSRSWILLIHLWLIFRVIVLAPSSRVVGFSEVILRNSSMAPCTYPSSNLTQRHWCLSHRFVMITDDNPYVTPFNLTMINEHVVAGPAVYLAGWDRCHTQSTVVLHSDNNRRHFLYSILVVCTRKALKPSKTKLAPTILSVSPTSSHTCRIGNIGRVDTNATRIPQTQAHKKGPVPLFIYIPREIPSNIRF